MSTTAQQSWDTAKKYNADTAAALLAAYMTGRRAHGIYRDVHRPTMNPFKKIEAVILGGVADPEGRPFTTSGTDSFSAQTNALARELHGKGINTKVVPGFIPGKVYENVPMLGIEDAMRRSDMLVQVGAHPRDEDLALASKQHNRLRYRQLSDWGRGNFEQPEHWLGGRNWMKVHDDPKGYTRLIVPGGEQQPLGKLERGQRKSLSISSIPTAKVFHDTPFNISPVTDTNPAKALVSLGGGAGGFQLFPDVVEGEYPKQSYNLDRRNILDDIVSALETKHGKNYKLKVLTGNIGQEIIDPATGLPKKANPALYGLFEKIKAMPDRFRNMEIVPGLSQADLAKEYGSSHYLFQMPGSTSAEVMAMPGGQHGKVVNLVPQDNWWSPGHYRTNAQFLEHPDIRKHLRGVESVNISGSDRLSRLTGAVGRGTPPAYGRQPLRADYSKMIGTLKRDAIFNRLRIGGKFAALALASLATGGYAANRMYGQTDYGKKHDVMAQAVDKIRALLK